MPSDHSPGSHDMGHGHAHDRGLPAMLRYLRFAREMWRSEINDAVIARVAPQPDETVMDIGAGAGAGTMVAVKSGAIVVSVEPTSYMRRVLGFRRLISRARDRVTIVDGAAEATNVAAGSIDAAWAVNSMHHWTDVEAAVAELARVLAPGGRVLLVDEDFDDPTHPEYGKFGAKRREEHSHHFDTVEPDAVATALTRAGLTVHSVGVDRIADRPSIIVEAQQAGRSDGV